MLIKAPCYFCGKIVEVEGKVGRRGDCPHCGRYLHACVQCKLHDRSYHNQCRESQAGYIADREAANFCEFFDFGRDVTVEKNKVSDAKKKLEEIFKK